MTPFLAYYVHHLNPFLIRFSESWGIRWYGMAYLAAFLAAYALTRHLSRQGLCDLPVAKVGDFIFGGAFFGVILGGRIGYMLFYNWQGFLADPLVFFRIQEGGMSAHGGILGLVFYSLWFARRHHVSWLNIGDSLVVCAPLGLLLGRLANFINGELYGRIASVAWAMQFPKELYDAPPELRSRAIAAATRLDPTWDSTESIIQASMTSPELRSQLADILTPRHPSQLYEAALEGGLLFAILWVLRTRFRLHDGTLTAAFFIGYAILRSLGEFFREPDAPLTGLLTRGQFLSVGLLLIGVSFWIASRRTKLTGPAEGIQIALGG